MKTVKIFCLLSLLIIITATLGCQIFATPDPSVTSPSTVQVTFLDVGQADAILIRSDNSIMLIDAGSNSSAQNLVNTLKDMGISKIDVLVGTHPHEDHIGGMDMVIDEFDIGQIYMPDVTANTRTFEDVLEAIENKGLNITIPVPGSSFPLGSAEWTILAPNSERYSDTNDYSIVIRLVHGDNSFLFTGDAHARSEEEMLNSSLTLQSDVLKVGHHGSRSSTSEEFLNAVSPEYAVILLGADNSYGHPHEETMEILNAGGIQIYRTDMNGDITFTSDASALTVETER